MTVVRLGELLARWWARESARTRNGRWTVPGSGLLQATPLSTEKAGQIAHTAKNVLCFGLFLLPFHALSSLSLYFFAFFVFAKLT